jgi:hypothetical protein
MGLGSGKNLFRIPDPRVKKAPDPGSATLVFLTQKILSGMFVPNPNFFPVPGPGSGSRGQKSTESRIRICNTERKYNNSCETVSLITCLYQQKGAEPGTGSSSCSVCFLLAPLRSSPRVEPKKTYSMDGQSLATTCNFRFTGKS